MFKKILIANRGEIACRVAASARRMGVKTVAVYSDADAQAKHVMACDEAVALGGNAPKESYLQWQRIIDAARQTGAQAIHPGYGFLSENEDFANACHEAGLVFIGPPASAIQAMGLKAESKRLMGAAGVPLVPGYQGEGQDPALLQKEADRIGYPVLIKASAGGGGKGMREVGQSADFAAALESCKREAINSFGDDAVLVEKYVQRPRHRRPGHPPRLRLPQRERGLRPGLRRPRPGLHRPARQRHQRHGLEGRIQTPDGSRRRAAGPGLPRC